MANLHEKVLETQKQNGHSVDDINAIVKSTIKKLNTEYRKGQNKKEVEDIYISHEYKAFITFMRNNKNEFNELLNECIIDETRITNFVKGKTKNPQHKTKDFFAVYCGFEGYNDFIIENKNTEISEKGMISTKNHQSNLQISGVTIIDNEFISKLDKKNISKSKFYAGIQNDNTQFHGVLKGYDIERKHYRETKSTMYSCFEGINDYPISAIVYGDGGSGKSIFLRKIAIDLAKDETFNATVLWLDGGNSIYEFMSHGIETLKKQSNLKFLLILEDWYRIMDTVSENQLEKFLKDIDSIKNIRIIIGDRTIRESYLKYFAGTKKDAVFLDNQENESIIRKIVLDFPEWQKTVDELFKSENSYQSTLFLLLFVIARTSQNDFENVNINPKEPLRTFINIIQSDFKLIQAEYPGLAKALYYWACIYAENKFLISYNAFIEVADFYNKNDFTILHNFENLELQSPIHEKLRIYIHKKSNGELRFNHDIFADFGISEICLDKLPILDDLIKIEFLDLIISTGYQYSASVFFSEIIKNSPSLLSKSEILRRINILLEQNSEYSMDVLNYLTELDLSITELKTYANLFIQRKYFNIYPFWKYYFSFYPDDEEIFCLLKNILQNSYEYHFLFIVEILYKFKDHLFVKEFINHTLQSNDWRKIHPRILSRLISSCQDEEIQKSFCNKVLMQKDWMKTDQEAILSNALIYADRNIAEKFSNKVLKRSDWKKFNQEFLWYCMEFAGKIVCQKFSDNLFRDEFWQSIDDQLVSFAFRFASDDIAQEFANSILSQNDWKKINNKFIYGCLDTASDYIAQEFSNKVLSDNDYWKTLNQYDLKLIFANAENEIIQSFYDRIFNSLDELIDVDKEILSIILKNHFAVTIAVLRTFPLEIDNWFMIYTSLNILKNVRPLRTEITTIIDKVISGYWSGIENFSFFYCHLLTLNLEGYKQWEDEIRKIENNWNDFSRDLITSVLRLYQAYPEKSELICLSILNSWKQEIKEPIPFIYFETEHYGEHLKIALGHPNLREKAGNLALEIYKNIKADAISIPEYLEEIVLQIVEVNTFPQWDCDGVETTKKEMMEIFQIDINEAIQFLQ